MKAVQSSRPRDAVPHTSASSPSVVYEPTTRCVRTPPLLVALPGLGGGALAFPTLAFAGVRDQGWRILAVSYAPHAATIADMAQDAWHTVLALDDTCPVLLLGYSMGGFVAQHIALHMLARRRHRMRLRGVVFMNTTCVTAPGALQIPFHAAKAHRAKLTWRQLWHFVRGKWRNPETCDLECFAKLLPPEFARGTPHVSVHTLLCHIAAVYRFAFEQHQCPCSALRTLPHDLPIAIIHAERDELLPPVPNVTNLLAEVPRATVLLIPDATHNFLITHTHAVNDALSEWCSTHVPQS